MDAFEGRMVGIDVMEADVRNALVGRGGGELVGAVVQGAEEGGGSGR